MGQRNVRVVVGQGDLDHAGSLRDLLERDDFDVVGDATNASQLARVLTDEQPDIVVLDDLIGISAVELAAEIVPDARLVVVWPAAVMPIAGAVRVDPSEVATTLTATVALAAGLSGLGAIDRPEWIERVKKDPATLREMLAARGALPARPSVTELQRRGHRLHPSPSAAKRATRSGDAAAAAVVPIGLAASRQEEPAEAAAAAAAAVPPAVLSATWNRRLGIIALGGAAAAGALMIAIALGPHPASRLAADAFPVTIRPAGGPAFIVGDGGGSQSPGGNGGGSTTPGDSAGGNGGGSVPAGGSTSPLGSLIGLGGGAGTGTGSGTAGSGSGTPTGSQGGGPRSSSSQLPGAHGLGKPGVPGWNDPTPGASGGHNPHGGPPGHGAHHGQGSGNGGGHGGGNSGGAGHGAANGHHNGNGGGNGQGAAHGNGVGHTQAASHGHGQAMGRTDGHGNAAAHQHKR